MRHENIQPNIQLNFMPQLSKFFRTSRRLNECSMSYITCVSVYLIFLSHAMESLPCAFHTCGRDKNPRIFHFLPSIQMPPIKSICHICVGISHYCYCVALQ